MKQSPTGSIWPQSTNGRTEANQKEHQDVSSQSAYFLPREKKKNILHEKFETGREKNLENSPRKKMCPRKKQQNSTQEKKSLPEKKKNNIFPVKIQKVN